jgi:hypothetical protein
VPKVLKETVVNNMDHLLCAANGELPIAKALLFGAHLGGALLENLGLPPGGARLQLV